MFRASPLSSSGAYNCINSLWFHRWSVGGISVVGCGLVSQTTTNNADTTNAPTVNPEAVNAVVSSR